MGVVRWGEDVVDDLMIWLWWVCHALEGVWLIWLVL